MDSGEQGCVSNMALACGCGQGCVQLVAQVFWGSARWGAMSWREAGQWWHRQWAAQVHVGGAGQKCRAQEGSLGFGAAQ